MGTSAAIALKTDNAVSGDIAEDVALLETEVTPVVEKKVEPPSKEVPPKKEGEEGEEKEVVEEVVEAHPDDAPLLNRPSIREVQEKYPKFFKDFPDVRHMFGREAAYTEVFPTVEDARVAGETLKDFTHLETLVTSGKPEDLGQFLAAVKEGGEASLGLLAANFLPTLHKADANLYYEATAPVVEGLLRTVHSEAQRSGNKNLENAALHIAQYIFGDAEVATGAKTTIKKREAPPDEPSVTAETAVLNERFNTLLEDVIGDGTEKLRGLILDGLDPDNAYGEDLREMMVERILKQVQTALRDDPSHTALMDSIWAKTKQDGFNRRWKASLVSAYLARAKAVMPAVRTKVRSGVMGGKESTRKPGPGKTEPIEGAVSTGRGERITRPVDANKVDWSKTSDLDMLEGRVTLKKE